MARNPDQKRSAAARNRTGDTRIFNPSRATITGYHRFREILSKWSLIKDLEASKISRYIFS